MNDVPLFLARDAFEELLGVTFEVFPFDGDAVGSLVLEEVTPLPSSGGDAKREPFSLLFKGEREFPQGTYRIVGNRREFPNIFLVPVGPDQAGKMSFESIFN